jgi:TetR/AcrR family transcriptional repressor of nem operon
MAPERDSHRRADWGLTGMARPKEFDREEALAKAIAVFTAYGYEGASTETLLTGMRISRQSMYDTFGDKRRLYLDALRRYSSDSTAEIIGVMHSQASAFKGLEAALLAFASRPATRPQDGCLGVSASTEFGRSDPAICAITDAAGTTMGAAFERIVRKGQAESPVPIIDPARAEGFRPCRSDLSNIAGHCAARSEKPALRRARQRFHSSKYGLFNPQSLKSRP